MTIIQISFLKMSITIKNLDEHTSALNTISEIKIYPILGVGGSYSVNHDNTISQTFVFLPLLRFQRMNYNLIHDE
jgi:hypothetical protein